MLSERRSFKTLWTALLLFLLLKCGCNACGSAEYRIGQECCPLCAPGTHVYRHCTFDTSTSCVPCTGSTFTDHPNGVTKCTSCTVCDQGLGVKTAKECTASSDTVCGVLEGNYCVDPYERGCRAAEKHTTCKPGQFIKRPGTEYTDTVCESCPDNSYSNGSSTACTPHTDCEAKKLPTVRLGDRTSDTQCGDKSRHRITSVLVPATLVVVVAVVVVVVVVVAVKCKHQEGAPSKNDNPDVSAEDRRVRGGSPVQTDCLPAVVLQ
ncbi:tumor necrosis factor receptor superfamily member 5-like isoform X1 [Arapaima gigas]